MNHYLFLFLIPLAIISQFYLLKPYLSFGLTDLDDGYTYFFRLLREDNTNFFVFLLKSLDWGIYAHQHYYLGLLNYFFKDNFTAYHQTTHILKILSIIATYPVFYTLSKSKIIAFLSSIFFAFSFAAIGSVAEGVIHGSVFLAIIMFSIFLTVYFYLIRQQTFNLSLSLLSLIFLMGTVVSATSRTFPVPILVLIIEIFILLKERSKSSLQIFLKRGGLLLSPIILIVIYRPDLVWVMLKPGIVKIGEIFSADRLDKLLTPIVVLSSTILPNSLIKILKISQNNNFIIFATKLLEILPVFLLTTVCLALITSENKIRFIFITALITIFGALLTYFFSISHPDSFVGFAVTGFYILGLTCSFFIEWLKEKSHAYLGLFVGLFTALFFILMMWIGTGEKDLVFIGINRYNTITAIFTSLFLGSLFSIFINKIKTGKKIFPKILSLFFLLFIPLYLTVSTNEISQYFKQRIQYGYGGADHVYMRSQLLPYYQDLSRKKLFYFYYFEDYDNSVYYGNTLFAGPWALWYLDKKITLEDLPLYVFDFDILKSSVTIHDNIKGVYYNGVFYPADNFYAFKLKDKRLIDISQETKKKLNLF